MATSRKYRTRFTQAVVTLSVSSTALGLNVPQVLAAPIASPTVLTAGLGASYCPEWRQQRPGLRRCGHLTAPCTSFG